MSAVDLSRRLFEPAKRYAGVVYQQGRVTLDSDWNEDAGLEGEELRRLIAEAVCGGGSPNDGFLVSGVTPAPGPDEPPTSTYEFSLAAGSFYLGGLRFDWANGETFLGQGDWLPIALDGDLPRAPTAAELAGGPRHDLVWLQAWEQSVTATEDSEILEQALGGPDTTARTRRMRRVRVRTALSEHCADALAALVAQLGPHAALDSATGALVSTTRLTVGFDPAGVTEDPCTPGAHAGYLGADNQAFRVQVTAPGRFIWGANNAAPLYRVQVEQFPEPGGGSTPRRLRFLTPPRDQASFPLAGQAVEILRWGARLPNQEKVAEATGLLATVERGYDPDDASIVLASPVPQEWIHWFDGAGVTELSERDPAADRRYFYLKLWTGGSGDAAAPDRAFTPGVTETLGGTGLTVTFSDPGRPGDHWIIAARPRTPQVVVPWLLMEGAPPAGPRTYLAPLAIITWRPGPGGAPIASVHDCRHRFRPLCEVSGCCTVTVGDGRESHGDVTSIQQAVDLLPPSGGQVCVLRGTYEEHVQVANRENVTIAGCGGDSRLRAGAGRTDPVITIRDSRGVRLERLGLEAPVAPAVHLDGHDGVPVEDIRLEDLVIQARNATAILGTGLRDVRLAACATEVLPLSAGLADDADVGREPAIYLAGDDLLVERCRIEVNAVAVRLRQPLGGLQIGGQSRRVRVRDTVIRRGNGHGITLGSVRLVRRDQDGVGGVAATDLTARVPTGTRPRGPMTLIGLSVIVDAQGCVLIDPDPRPPRGDDVGEPLVPVSDGALEDVAIVDCTIEDMGASGISVARFFDLSREPDYISIEGLEIARNRIRRCVRLELPALTGALRIHSAFGGIALAHCERLVVRDNAIEDCGTRIGDPVCGLFALLVEAATIERNRITENGRRSSTDVPPRPGRRGGVVVGLALPGSTPADVPFLRRGGLRQDGAPALRAHDNVIVAPEGRALDVIAIGPVSVGDNQLTSRGGARIPREPAVTTAPTGGFGLSHSAATSFAAVAGESGDPLLGFIDLLGGAVVAVVNLGVSTELYLQLAGFAGLGLVDRGPADRTPLNDDDDDLFFGGEVLFDANQVTLDALAPDVRVAASAVLLLSADDIAMTGNQSTCDLLLDFVLTNALVVAFSLRVNDNRLKEPLGTPDFRPVFLSALTLGLMNQTTQNQGTHCFYALGAPALSVLAPNRSLIDVFDPRACREFRRQNEAELGHFAVGHAFMAGG